MMTYSDITQRVVDLLGTRVRVAVYGGFNTWRLTSECNASLVEKAADADWVIVNCAELTPEAMLQAAEYLEECVKITNVLLIDPPQPDVFPSVQTTSVEDYGDHRLSIGIRMV